MYSYQEIFNDLHSKQFNQTPSSSLISLLKNDLSPFILNKNLILENILEIGCGTFSIFDHWDLIKKYKKIQKTAIDCSNVAIKKAKESNEESDVKFLTCDITKPEILNFPSGILSGLVPHDLILDSHALHFVKDQHDRSRAFKNIFHLLINGGLFVGESTIRTNSFQTSDYFHLPYAHELENELIQAGFEIKIFIVRPGLHLESFESGVFERFEVVSFIASKK